MGSDSDNEHTPSKYQIAANHIESWAHSNHLIRLSQITPDTLDHWKSSWSVSKALHRKHSSSMCLFAVSALELRFNRGQNVVITCKPHVEGRQQEDAHD
jgi:hypothetical protein